MKTIQESKFDVFAVVLRYLDLQLFYFIDCCETTISDEVVQLKNMRF